MSPETTPLDPEVLPTELLDVLSPLPSACVMLSGGIDSEVLLRGAVLAGGEENVLALTADSPLLADHYRRLVRRIAKAVGVRHELVTWAPLEVAGLVENGPDRCYHCKREMYRVMEERGRELGFGEVLDGTNADDFETDRPGLRAAAEAGVLHPLARAGLGESDVRRLAQSLGALKPDRPSDSCLATRMEEGCRLTREDLGLVERMEAPLRPMVKKRFRVHLYGPVAVVHYRERDATAVNRMRKTMKDMARESGVRRIRFILEDA
ncbi:TIGR00268 family protein [Candidatus Fermentibacteria bacterium]|nr:TIGR00268 family protein [Candidatus Fermentibacteria bacterium]